MDKKVTINDIAREAGVSRTLVSSVLCNMQRGNKHYRVSEETTNKIKEVMAKYDYRPNDSARTLRSGNNKIIGVILSDISNRFFAEVSRRIEDWAHQFGYLVIFGNTDEKAENLAEGVEMLYSKGVQGMIIVPCPGSEGTIISYKKRGLPIVLLDRDFPDSGLSSVVLDNRKASVELTDRLIDEGYSRIEFVSYDTTLANIQERERGYEDAMKARGLGCNITIHRPEYGNFEQVETIVLDAYAKKSEAMIFSTYRLALLGRRATIRHNLGNDCSFACFNNSDTFDIYERGMLFVKQPIEEFARNSVTLLIDEIENGDPECRKLILSPEVEITNP